jgi:hypothetical protein
MEGTRQGLISMIRDWIDETHSSNIFWLKGSPGAGKSAVAATMVRLLREEGRLGSSFFFKRGHVALGDPNSLWRTVAFDLAKFHPYLRTKILDTLKEGRINPTSPDIKAHFRRFIHDPFLNLFNDLPKFPIVIIDAADECAADETQRRLFLETLKDWANLPSAYKLLVTSRDYVDIADALRDVCRSDVIPTGDVVTIDSSNDIFLYLSASFRRIASSVMYDEILPKDWPGSAVLMDLTERAAGLFIWAATIVKLLEDDDEDPESQLELVLGTTSLSNIDALYIQILESAFGKSKNSRHIATFKTIVGGIVAAKVALNHADLVRLQGFPEPNAVSAFVLRKLRPVISADGADHCLRLSHQSFADFVCDDNRCPERYRIDLGYVNSCFVENCLAIMNHPTTGLQFDICKIPTSHLPNESIDGLGDRIKEAISPSLSYSCRFWLDHIRASNAIIPDVVNQFMRAKFLYWIEVLSLTKGMSGASPNLQLLSQWCEVSFLVIYLADY